MQLNSPILQGSASKPARFALVILTSMFKGFCMCCRLLGIAPLEHKDVLVNFCATQPCSYVFKFIIQFCEVIHKITR